jgi:hypothetical protein
MADATTTPPRDDNSADEKHVGEVRDASDRALRAADGASLTSGEDLLALQDLDPALNLKMHLVNNVRMSPSLPTVTSRETSSCHIALTVVFALRDF